MACECFSPTRVFWLLKQLFGGAGLERSFSPLHPRVRPAAGVKLGTPTLPFCLHPAAWHSQAPHHVAAHVGTSARHVRCHTVSHIGRQGELQKA